MCQCYCIPFTITLFLLFDNYVCAVIFHPANCTYSNHNNTPEVYYVNMKNSTIRNKTISNLLSHMNLPYHRIEGISSDKVYIPDDILQSFRSKKCKFNTNESISQSISLMNQSNIYIVNGLCLGYNYNNDKSMKKLMIELYCAMAHLLAIYTAINSPTATSKYALVTEDDMFFPFDIDYNTLADAAPVDLWGILQLFTSDKYVKAYTHVIYMSTTYFFTHIHTVYTYMYCLYIYRYSVSALWGQYDTRPENLWDIHRPTFWSAGFYLIHRERLKSIINSIVTIDPAYPHITQFKIIAGYTSQLEGCFPLECCPNLTYDNRSLACIHSEYAVSDTYLYSISKSYTIRIPLAFPDYKKEISSINAMHDGQEIALTYQITTKLKSMLQHNNHMKLPYYMSFACTHSNKNKGHNKQQHHINKEVNS